MVGAPMAYVIRASSKLATPERGNNLGVAIPNLDVTTPGRGISMESYVIISINLLFNYPETMSECRLY